MKDRFKFRAIINNEIKDVYYFYELPNNKDVVFICTDFENCKGHYISSNQLVPCTGKKDKNNNLIFEGDIVRFYFDNDEIIAVVEWDDDECRFYLNTTDFFKDKYVTDYEIVNQEEYEVIGNIYENPDLLK